MVIPLPVDYVRIIGRKNNSYVVAFDLRYFDYFTDDARKKKLAGFPKEIQEGWMKKNNGGFDGSWLVLDNTKTIVTKIKSEISDPYSPNVQHGVLTLIGAGSGPDGKSAAGLMTLADKQKLDSIDPEKIESISESLEWGTM